MTIYNDIYKNRDKIDNNSYNSSNDLNSNLGKEQYARLRK